MTDEELCQAQWVDVPVGGVGVDREEEAVCPAVQVLVVDEDDDAVAYLSPPGTTPRKIPASP